MHRRLIAAVGVALVLGACANLGRISQYHGLGDANLRVDGQGYKMWLHPSDNTLLLQKGVGKMLTGGAAQGATFGTGGPSVAETPWFNAANALLRPLGCEAGQMTDLGQHLTWEATYTCPPGVDIRAEVNAHRETLRKGVPLTGAPKP